MKRLLSVILALAMILALAACGGERARDVSEPTHDDAGYYAIFSITDEDGTINQSDFERMDWTVFLELNEDGTGVLDLDDGDVSPITWQDGSISADGDTVPYVLAGGMLTLDLTDDDGAFVMIFKKGEKPAAEEASAGGLGGMIGAAAAGAEPQSEPEPQSAPAGPIEVTELPAAGDIRGDYHVAIIGAEAFSDSNDKDAVRFYYEFTNNSDETTSAWWETTLAAEQEGYELVSTYPHYDGYALEDGNEDLELQPGVTIRCVEEYSFKPTGGELVFTISDYGDDPVTAVFDPANLPGAPAEPWTIGLIEDPQTFAGYDTAASTDNIDVEILDTEVVPGLGKEYDVLRASFALTNNTDEVDKPWWLLTISAYQDGIGLKTGAPANALDSDDLYYDDIQPGDTVVVSCCWQLRTGSPVEITVEDFLAYDNEIVAAAIVTLD